MDYDLDRFDSDRSDSDRSDSNLSVPGLTFDHPFGLFPSTFDPSETMREWLTNYPLLTHDEIHWSVPYRYAHLIPVEILCEIFLYTIQANPSYQVDLMLVCRRWRDVMLSTPGIHSQLRINSQTKGIYLESFGKRWLFDVTVDMWGYNPKKDNGAYFKFHACFMAAAEAASRWRSLTLLSLPPPGEFKDLQIVHPLQHLESFKLTTSCNLGNSLEPLLKAIVTTVTPRFTVMEVLHPDSALYLLQPAHFQIFSSLTTLRLNCRRMQNPVDILPSIHKLKFFYAHHLFLPIYPPGVVLPLTQTLRVLHLKSVSVQWMAGQIFPALNECSIIFPHHADAIQSVDMPSCSILKYDSNSLSALEHFHISTLRNLEIKCGQWRPWSGDLQLIRLHPIFAAQSLASLHLEIKCNERLLVPMLRLVPSLRELCMKLSSPRALSIAFFLALAAGGRKANAGAPSQTIIPLGRKLRRLQLDYKRWLRGPERMALIPAFGAIVASHPPEDRFRFHLGLDEGSKLQKWYIREPVARLDIEQRDWMITIGVPSPDGIVHLSIPHDYADFDESPAETAPIQLPRETEYIITKDFVYNSNDFLISFHHGLKVVRAPNSKLGMKQDPQFSLDAPLFHTLKVLDVWTISSSVFAGQTFHKLERYRERYTGDIPGEALLTEMPVCTRLDVPLRRLATLKLPQIRKLGLSIDYDADFDCIWDKHIVINVNLSGLKLLHLRYQETTRSTIDAIKILGSLPAVETLITYFEFGPSIVVPDVDFFKALVPMNVSGPSALNHSSWKGQISGVLCPRLKNLHIRGGSPMQPTTLMPILKDIVTLRAIIGSPLMSFTFFEESMKETHRMWQLIGRDKSFVLEKVVPAKRLGLVI